IGRGTEGTVESPRKLGPVRPSRLALDLQHRFLGEQEGLAIDDHLGDYTLLLQPLPDLVELHLGEKVPRLPVELLRVEALFLQLLLDPVEVELPQYQRLDLGGISNQSCCV